LGRIGTALQIYKQNHDGSADFVSNLTMTHVDAGSCNGFEPAIPTHETEDFMRAIMDAAWKMGIRPTGFSDHTNELSAVRFHLEDMRKLAKVK
jgi:hypothetical protein